MTATCDLCSRPMGDQAYVCSVCTNRLREALERVLLFAGEVEAARDVASVGNTVGTWARHVSEEKGVPVPRERGEPGAVAATRFLLASLEWLRHRQEAKDVVDELLYASSLLERTLNGPSVRWYAGPCRAELVDDDGAQTGELCDEDLYAAPGARVVRCRVCGAEMDAAARKEWLLKEAEIALVHAELLGRALAALDVEGVTSSRIRNLADRGRLVAKGIDQLGRPLYKVAEVLAIVREQDATKAKRQVERAAKDARRAEKAADRAVVDTATIDADDRSAVGEVSPNQGGPRLSCA